MMLWVVRVEVDSPAAVFPWRLAEREATVELNGRRRGRGRRRRASIAGRTYLTLAIISFCFVAELIIQ